MSKRPAYLKNKRGSYWVVSAVLAALIWLIYGYGNDFPLQPLVDNSEFKNRGFQGRVEEIAIPEKGLTFYFMQEDTNPLVAVSFIFDHAGTAYDPQDKQGLAMLTAASLKDGAGKYSAEALREEMAIRGIKIEFGADKDVFSGQMTAPKSSLPEAAEWLKLILSRPRFEEKYLVSAKDQILKVLETEKENPEKELALAFNRKIYVAHPYGRNPLGTPETVAALRRSDLQDFVSRKFGRNNLYIGIAGDLTGKEAAALAGLIFGDLPEKAEVEPLETPDIDWQQSVLNIRRGGGQNIAAFAAAGTCRQCEDFYPLYIANYLFGGAGLNSRLNQRIREKEGLTYGGYSALTLNDRANLLVAGFAATPEKFARARELFLQEWQKAGETGFTEEELRAAKDYLTASYNLRFASIAGISDMLAYMQKYDLGLDFLQKRNGYVEGVTAEQLNRAAKQYFNNNLLQAGIGFFGKEGEDE